MYCSTSGVTDDQIVPPTCARSSTGDLIDSWSCLTNPQSMIVHFRGASGRRSEVRGCGTPSSCGERSAGGGSLGSSCGERSRRKDRSPAKAVPLFLRHGSLPDADTGNNSRHEQQRTDEQQRTGGRLPSRRGPLKAVTGFLLLFVLVRPVRCCSCRDGLESSSQRSCRTVRGEQWRSRSSARFARIRMTE